MTDVASEIPVQRREATAEAELQRGPGAIEQLGETVGDAVERAGAAVERATAASGRIASQVVDRVRNTAELPADRGATSIADEVVEKIAGIAARDVPGVYDLGGDVARFFASVKERVGMADSAEDADRGISVRLDGNTAAIDVTLVLEYGFVVHSVTEKVRAKVVTAVENLLGLSVIEVNIRVDDIHVEDTGPVGDDESRAVDYQV
ncbi:Asp23/Gls24 family envelope stress response protein [Micromonospora sp. NPDC049679]|uniref:Asp23/Gls24 family envelope stress response protein n=1 Tax=Micromonospora sp. NPDC049679 TaxID=3155920 RepID=UPI0033F6FCDA